MPPRTILLVHGLFGGGGGGREEGDDNDDKDVRVYALDLLGCGWPSKPFRDDPNGGVGEWRERTFPGLLRYSIVSRVERGGRSRSTSTRRGRRRRRRRRRSRSSRRWKAGAAVV